MSARTPWRVPEVDAALVQRLSAALKTPPLVAQVLARRGFTEPDAAARHLRADLRDMPAPSSLHDCERAARRLVAAIDAGERITVYGDYDVDGVTSSALLQLFFRHELGVELGIYIPHRMREGYGLNEEAIRRIAADGTKVLVTVDNGSSAVAEVAAARASGLDVVIIDHHQVSDPEPGAFAHLNPHRGGCGFPDKVLAAVGVAFYLLVELRRVMRALGRFAGRAEPRPDAYLDLVALGTVADVAPLTGVNRALVRHGLATLRRAPRLGIRALTDVARVDSGAVTARDLGYKLGPRINAAGRLDDATRGLRLLVTEDPDEARRLAAEVEAQNDERRGIEQAMTREAVARVERMGNRLPAALVLADEGWHPGVVGIVAARLVERFQRPAVMLARDAGQWKGSARSTRGFHLKRALDTCSDHLTRWGGHGAAAGLSLPEAKLARFREAFVAAVAAALPEADATGVEVDAVASLSSLDAHTVEELERLGPFGAANPAPLLLVPGVVGRGRRVGEDHLKLDLPPADLPREAMGFGLAGALPHCGGPVDLLCTPESETFRGRRRLTLRLHDLRPALDR